MKVSNRGASRGGGACKRSGTVCQSNPLWWPLRPRATEAVQVLHQSSNRRHGDCDRHRHRRRSDHHSLPVLSFPNIAPPKSRSLATYVGADAQTLEQSVATPTSSRERRGQHELHVLSERDGEFANHSDREFPMFKTDAQYRSDSRPVRETQPHLSYP